MMFSAMGQLDTYVLELLLARNFFLDYISIYFRNINISSLKGMVEAIFCCLSRSSKSLSSGYPLLYFLRWEALKSSPSFVMGPTFFLY